MTYFAILGFAMIFLIVFLLLRKKLTPFMAFCIISPIIGLLAGYNFIEISDFAKEGISSTLSSALMALVSVVYFSIMTDAGLFDPIVNALIKRAKGSYVIIMVSASLIAHLSHLDTGTMSTLLVTFPAMIPIFKRMKIDLKYLYLIVAQAISTVNLLPWGGYAIRASAVTGIDPTTILVGMAPIIAFGIVFNIGTCVYFGIKLGKKNKGIVLQDETLEATESIDLGNGTAASIDQEVKTSGKRLYALNATLTLVILVLMFTDKFTGYFLFMIGLALALLINYRTTKEWNKVLEKYAGNAYNICATMFAAGIFLGILNNTPMMEDMAATIIKLIPESVGSFYAVFIAIIGCVLGVFINAEAFIYGMLPLFITAGKELGFSVESIMYATIITRNIISFISPTSSVTWLGAGMLNEEFSDCAKFSAVPLLILVALTIILMVAIGMVPIL